MASLQRIVLQKVDESEGEDGRGPEGSDFAAEEGYEEDGCGPGVWV
jgi:hypothetical protein